MEIHERHELPRLRERRLQRGLTQQEVAEGLERLAWVQSTRRVGVNADMVSKWERGQKPPSRFYPGQVFLTGDMNAQRTPYCAFAGRAGMVSMGGGRLHGTCRSPVHAGIDWIFGSHGSRFAFFLTHRGSLVRKTTDHPLVLAKVH